MSGTPQNTLPLKDIHLPPAISAWPPAPGWWISVIALVCVLAAISYAVVRYRRRTAYRRAALLAAKQCGERFQQHNNKTQLAVDSSELLRRVAIAAYGKRAAGVSGKHWLHFLDARMVSTRQAAKKNRSNKSSAPMFSNLEPALLEAPYRPGVDYDTQALQRALMHWIKHHKALE
jgi:Tfp pilus assembly protein PilE